jgi:NAD(P)-dependent dehydrogenase (short-subunit alcohol dehydrogenase family)
MFRDEVISITGAASGIGRATAWRAAESGAERLVLVDRDEAALDTVAAALRGRGCHVEVIVGSVVDHTVPDEVVRRAVERFGRLDSAANCAGVLGDLVPIDACTDEQFDEVIDVNLRSVFRCLRAQLRQMYRQGNGAIVNISSTSVLATSPSGAAYVTSKQGVIGLSKVASKEAGPHGVRVNTVIPGRTDTPMLRRFADDDAGGSSEARPISGGAPLGRVADPSEVAEAVLWLCSSRSSFVTGAALVVDGGRTG